MLRAGCRCRIGADGWTGGEMAQDLTEKSNRSGTSRSVESLLRVGARIRGLRRSHGLTQEELAHRSNLTKGFISQLERDLTSPSLESLLEILETLDTDIVRFFQGHQEGRIVFGAADSRNAATYPEVRAFELMVPGAANRNMESALVTMEPGESVAEEAHAGEEFGYVLKGKVQVTYGEKRAAAKRGEWFYFASDRNHRVANPYKKRAKLLWVSTPPSF